MHNTATPAGTAAPTPAAVALPKYQVRNFTEADVLRLSAVDYSDDPSISADKLVTLTAHGGSCSFRHAMTPAQARLLAVYLVDCANALDNPADRVIVDEADHV